jgi:Xaa-Pro aminopeptidase
MGKTETINPRQGTLQGAHSRRTTMLRKLTLALVAAASLSAMALAPTAASAMPLWGWGGGYHHHFGHGFGLRFVGGGYGDEGCYVTRRVLTDFGYRLRVVNVCGY